MVIFSHITHNVNFVDTYMFLAFQNNSHDINFKTSRSPEEKVKGQGKAIYRGPLMLSTKYW